MSDNDGKLIEVDFKTRAAFTVRKKHHSPCRHPTKTVDEHLRIVTCNVCETKLDPLSVILDIVDGWDRYTLQLRQTKADLKHKREELETTKRDVRNAKAQLRRARKE